MRRERGGQGGLQEEEVEEKEEEARSQSQILRDCRRFRCASIRPDSTLDPSSSSAAPQKDWEWTQASTGRTVAAEDGAFSLSE